MVQKFIVLGLVVLSLLLTLSACAGGSEYLAEQYRTLIAPPAQTAAIIGGQIAQTQGAKLLQTAQIKLATESTNLKETAKVEAATAAAGLFDTAQAGLVTQAAEQATVGPTQLSNLKQTAEVVLATQAALRIPQLKTEAAELQGTAAARLDSKAAERLPQAMTQAASFNQTVQAGALVETEIPPELRTQAIHLGLTAQAGLATQVARLQANATPTPLSPQPNTAIIVYVVREGDVLSSIASRLGIPVEKIVLFNQLRFPWLATSPEALAAGMALIVGVIPDDSQAPVVPAQQSGWSNTANCDVSVVDWLESPITCQPAAIDVVSKIEMTLGCVSLDNPLGYNLTHNLIEGWMLTGANGTAGYGWYIDLDRDAVIVGPAIISHISSSSECRAPGK